MQESLPEEYGVSTDRIIRNATVFLLGPHYVDLLVAVLEAPYGTGELRIAHLVRKSEVFLQIGNIIADDFALHLKFKEDVLLQKSATIYHDSPFLLQDTKRFRILCATDKTSQMPF